MESCTRCGGENRRIETLGKIDIRGFPGLGRCHNCGFWSYEGHEIGHIFVSLKGEVKICRLDGADIQPIFN
jgi:hypothetical protein